LSEPVLFPIEKRAKCSSKFAIIKERRKEVDLLPCCELTIKSLLPAAGKRGLMKRGKAPKKIIARPLREKIGYALKSTPWGDRAKTKRTRFTSATEKGEKLRGKGGTYANTRETRRKNQKYWK